jgi:hypothetical protein
VKPAAGPLHSLGDHQRATVEFDVRPAETEQLATAQAHGGRHDPQRVQPVALGGGQELLDLVDGQTLADPIAGRGHSDQLGDVPRDQLLSHGLLERVTEHGVHELDLPNGRVVLATAAH